MTEKTPPKTTGRKAKATTATKTLPTGSCDMLDEFARLCGVADTRELRALAAAGDCQFDHRCPEARECPVAGQTLYRPRKIMILPYNDKHQPYKPAKNGGGTASVDFSDFWY